MLEDFQKFFRLLSENCLSSFVNFESCLLMNFYYGRNELIGIFFCFSTIQVVINVMFVDNCFSCFRKFFNIPIQNWNIEGKEAAPKDITFISYTFGLFDLSQDDQSMSFSEAILELQNNKPIENSSRLYALTAFPDKEEILRVKGKLEQSEDLNYFAFYLG